MKPINTSCALILGVLTLFSISNANAGGCSSHAHKKVEIESKVRTPKIKAHEVLLGFISFIFIMEK